tara:strand:- start:813 stop:1301 length:489 start_codon:yes stop_codon:yes gene_type:complete
MAIINVSAGSEAVIYLGQDATNANISTSPTVALVVPYMQDVTINNSTGVFRWKTLDSTAENAATTPATNQLTLNAVVDTLAFFGDAAGTDTVKVAGLFNASKNKTRVYFSVGFNGSDTGSTYLTGSGFISGLAPTVNMDSPVWITPITIEVDGDFTQQVVPA